MSVESIAIALHHSRSRGSAKLVLLGIANHDGDGGAWPSLATLAKYAGGIDRKQVKRAVDKLEELGEVRQYTMAGGNAATADHLRPNRYEILVRCPEHCDRTPQHRDRRKPLIRFEELSGGGITPGVESPRGGITPGRGVTTPPEPPRNLNQHIEKKSHVPERGRANMTPEECGLTFGHQKATFDAETGTCARCREAVAS